MVDERITLPHVVSTRGGVFRNLNGPGDDTPLDHIDVVVLSGGPLWRTFFAKPYVPGSEEPPTCASIDGRAPCEDAREPQATLCKDCRHFDGIVERDRWRSGACRASRWIALLPVAEARHADCARIVHLRVPSGSLQALAEFGTGMKRRDALFFAAATRIGFSAATGRHLTFRPLRYLTDEEFQRVLHLRDGLDDLSTPLA